MKLYIAEKPSLGRAIADALPKPLTKADGYIKAANGDTVSWCIGHLLEQVEPDHYSERYKKWQATDLPIVPEKWQLKPKSKTRSQLAVLRKLVKQATLIVHAGDPDREGQLLVDELLEYVGLSKSAKQSVLRVLISDMNVKAVRRALDQEQSNTDFVPLSTSALARSRADWLYGMNLTRAFTLAGQKGGFSGVLSVGRVQTPVLGLVVRRDIEIEDFRPKPFYEVYASLCTKEGEAFEAKWHPSDACQAYLDEDGRVLSRPLAERVAASIKGKPGTVEQFESKPKSQSSPLPYNLSSLQIDAARRFKMSAQQVLTTCQDLYERHKLITYPRSDCRYLPKEHFKEAEGLIAAIANNAPDLSAAARSADAALKSRAWNDAKVGAHHAIIPTSRRLDSSKLSKPEANVYELIARQYLVQFYPEHRYQEAKVAVRVETGLFKASARVVIDEGWKALFPSKDDDKAKTLPVLSKGQIVDCVDSTLRDRMTQAPLPFTDASLLAAMTGIARFVKDDELRKILRDTDGLGTEATRAGIIELLFRREFLSRQGKNIVSTAAGRALIACLPEAASLPDMTAKWEKHLEAISLREASYGSFMQPLEQSVGSLVIEAERADAALFQGLKGPARSGRKKSKSTARKRNTGASSPRRAKRSGTNG